MEEKLNIKDILKSFKELKESQDRLSISQAKTDKQINALTQDIFGISNSIGQEAEEFFYNAIKDKMQIGGVSFDYSYKNDRIRIKGQEQQIDILLENGNSVGVVEVKNKVTKKTIKQMEQIIEKFYYFHPYFKDYKIIPAIAGKVFPEELQKIALKKGYSVLMQKGDFMEQVNP
jgi:hypothetical protein